MRCNLSLPGMGDEGSDELTRCVEWYDKFEKDGDFCHLSPAGISSVKAYNELRVKIAQHIPDKAFVVDNFPEGAARPLIHCKDDETRVKGLNYVIDCLNRKEKVTAGDLQTTINGWLKPNSCPVVKKESNPGHVSKNFTNVKSPREQKPILPVEKPKSTNAGSAKVPPAPIAPLHPSLGQVMAAKQEPEICTLPEIIEQKSPVILKDSYTPPPPRPAPCTLLKQCPDLDNHVKTEKVRGRICDIIGVPCNQLPGNECPLERKNRLKNTPVAAFVRASDDMSELDAAKPIKPAPYVIKKALLTDGERDWSTNMLIERTAFTPKDIQQIDELISAGYEGCKCRFDLIETAVMQYLAKAEGA